jgi:hypothetical protein
MTAPNDLLPQQQYPTARARAMQQLLAETVTSGSRELRGRRRLSLLVAGALTIGVAGTGTAIAYGRLGSAPVTDQHSARCYTVAKYTAGENFPGTTITEADSATTAGRVASAIDVCASLWRAGLLQAGVAAPVRSPSQAVNPVPGLVACTLRDGRAAVFPGPAGTCQTLGLADAAH